MRRNPHTRNIFTAEGRLNRRIDKYNKTVGLINKLDEILEHIVNKVDNNMGIPIDKINEKINQEIIANEEKEECVICCEGCSHEFNILDNSIKKIHVNNTENISTTDTKYVCPKCGFQNEIDFDNESNEDDLDICEDDCNCDDKKCDLCEDMNKDEILSINSKRINIKKGIKKSRKIIINKTIPFKIIHDEEIISGIDIALNHGSVSESIEMLKNKNIDITKNSTDNSKSYCTNTGFITFIHGENDNNKTYYELQDNYYKITSEQ